MRVLPGLTVGIMSAAALWALFAHDNPGGMSDAKYSRFNSAAPPKLLYSCTRKPTRESLAPQLRACIDTGRAGCAEKVDEWVETGSTTEVDFVAGSGTSTYDELLQTARHKCSAHVGNLGSGEFEVIESDQS